MTLRRAIMIAAVTALAAACESLIGADFDSAEPRPEHDAGSEASTDAGTDTGTSQCVSEQPEAPPDLVDGGGDTSLSVVLYDVDLGETPGAEGTPGYLTLGFDVDHTCTNQGDAPKCLPAAWTEGDPTDGPQGQDNGVCHILATQESTFGLKVVSEKIVNDAIVKGRFAPLGLVTIDGYNGFESDDQVTVKWHVALPADEDPAFTPKLDGTDAWPVASADSVTGGSKTEPAIFEDDSAYVSKRRLVARFPKNLVPLGSVFLAANEMVLTGTLTFDVAKQTHVLSDGLIAGWSSTQELLRVIPPITIDFLGVPLCTDGATYPDTKKFICAGADLATADHVPGQPCDALGFGIGFQSTGATIGLVAPLPTSKAQCPAATDPSKDTCDTPAK